MSTLFSARYLLLALLVLITALFALAYRAEE
jgi:hypothetical protein